MSLLLLVSGSSVSKVTQLSPSAVPGRRYKFSAKTEAVAPSGPHPGGPFTELSNTALPGMRHSFSAKTEAAIASGPHTGLFTELSAMALPGARHSFLAKTEAPVTTASTRQDGSYPLGMSRPKYLALKRDDRDIMDLVQIIVTSGILE